MSGVEVRDIIYPDGSSEKHPEVGWVGGYGVSFGDQHNAAGYIPLGEDQTNNWGELRAALCSLQGHRAGLIFPSGLWMVAVLSWWPLDGCCSFLVASGWLQDHSRSRNQGSELSSADQTRSQD